jgi:hypothetical protein
MPGFWGADTLAYLTSSVDGDTLAYYVIDVQYSGAPHDQIVWWGRYFDHGTSSGNDHWQGNSEADALSTAVADYSNPTGGKSWILPIASPYPTPGPSSTYATGVADGNYVGGIIAGNLTSRLRLPGNGILYVFLDIENGQDISTSYLEGWGDAIDSYEISGSVPLFPCCYINPNDSTDVSHVNSSGYYFQAWTSEPEPICSGCYSPGPAWSGVQTVSGLATNVWQYGEANSDCASCRDQTVYADLDQTNPSIAGTYGYGQCDNMLFIPAS